VDEWERRLRWHCRRGMLEMDLLLQRFLDRHLATLTADERGALEDLLKYDDIELTAFLNGRRECPDPRFASLLERIRGL
jgi:succinate dehydrogenase flavin-adding protein (antitoxin of CptAB toxin-antitoxin module)